MKVSPGLFFFLEAPGENLFPAHSGCGQHLVPRGCGPEVFDSLLTTGCGLIPASRGRPDALAHGPLRWSPSYASMCPVPPASLADFPAFVFYFIGSM